VNVTAGATSSLGRAVKFACRCLICSILDGSGFFGALGLTVAAGLVCAVAGVALAVVAAAGVVLAVGAAAGVLLAVVAAAGEEVAAGLAGLVVAVVAAGEVVVLGVAGVALAVVVAGLLVAGVIVLAGPFLSFRLSVDFRVLSAGVSVVVAGRSVEGFVSGAVAGAGLSDFLLDGPFLSGFAAGSVAAGASDFGATAGASVFGATAGASVFGARGALGFTSAGAFLSAFLPGACDSSGVGSWATAAPASASEQTISKLVNFFMLILFWS
jgi:hypothetical protein